MLDILILVILIAWVFGISYSAAAQGLLSFVLWIILICFIIVIVGDILDGIKVQQPLSKKAKTPKPILAPTKTKPAKKKEHSKISTIISWAMCFIVCYIITTLLLVIFGIWDNINAPMWIVLAIPSLPFVIILGNSLIRKYIKNKKARRK